MKPKQMLQSFRPASSIFPPNQVSFVQYSDDAKTEFKLNSYGDKGIAMAALHLIRYQGGNTKTGRFSGGFEQSPRSAGRSSHEVSFLRGRNGAQTHLREGVLVRKRDEKKRPEAGGRHHRWALPG